MRATHFARRNSKGMSDQGGNTGISNRNHRQQSIGKITHTPFFLPCGFILFKYLHAAFQPHTEGIIAKQKARKSVLRKQKLTY